MCFLFVLHAYLFEDFVTCLFNDVAAQLNYSWCVTLGDLYILPNFATVSTSTSLPCMIVAWGGVEQWSDRNPKGIHQVSCKFS